jgi:hypothetical protein
MASSSSTKNTTTEKVEKKFQHEKIKERNDHNYIRHDLTMVGVMARDLELETQSKIIELLGTERSQKRDTFLRFFYKQKGEHQMITELVGKTLEKEDERIERKEQGLDAIRKGKMV